jgi:hypothetical protein
MKIEIYPNALSQVDIDKLMFDINPAQNAKPITYSMHADVTFACKKVKCTDHPIVKRISDSSEYITESASIVYYPTGSNNPPHIDNSTKFLDGTVTRVQKWNYTGVIFLNDNFDGGNLVYPTQGCVFIPTVGTMIIAPAGEDYIHFVEEVTKGERFTLVFRFV